MLSTINVGSLSLVADDQLNLSTPDSLHIKDNGIIKTIGKNPSSLSMSGHFGFGSPKKYFQSKTDFTSARTWEDVLNGRSISRLGAITRNPLDIDGIQFKVSLPPDDTLPTSTAFNIYKVNSNQVNLELFYTQTYWGQYDFEIRCTDYTLFTHTFQLDPNLRVSGNLQYIKELTTNVFTEHTGFDISMGNWVRIAYGPNFLIEGQLHSYIRGIRFQLFLLP